MYMYVYNCVLYIIYESKYFLKITLKRCCSYLNSNKKSKKRDVRIISMYISLRNKSQAHGFSNVYSKDFLIIFDF